MVSNKRLGVAASVVMSETLADKVDEEMMRLRLPSRAAMIRLCIEEYFTPDDTSRFDHTLEKCEVELRDYKEELKIVSDIADRRLEAIQFLRSECDKWSAQVDKLMKILEAGAQHTLDTDRVILAPRAPAQIQEFTPKKPKKYREYWWQFWLPLREQ